MMNEPSLWTYTHEILPKVFLGGSPSLKIIDSLGISGIICLDSSDYTIDTFRTISLHSIDLLLINIDDLPSERIDLHFDSTFEFIQSHPKGVLIHCKAGISRSVSILISYLCRVFKCSSEEGLKMIKEKRCIANPNKGFMYLLKKRYM